LNDHLDLRVEALATCKPVRPVECRRPAPRVRRRRQAFPRRPAEALGAEIIEGSLDVAERRATLGAVKGGGDDGILAGMQAPGTGEPHDRSGHESDGCACVVFGPAFGQRQAAGEQRTRNRLDGRKVQRPKREIDQVHAQIHHTAATGKCGIVEPRLVRSVAVVKNQIHRKDLAELALGDELANPLHAAGEPIGEVDRQETIRPAGCLDRGMRLGDVASERLLTKNRTAGIQSADRLLGMKCTGCRDHDAVELQLQEIVQRRTDRGVGRHAGSLPRRIALRIGNARGIHQVRSEHGFHAMASDPTDPEEAHARSKGIARAGHAGGKGIVHGTTTAFRNPSGRSRVASSASSRRSSG